MSFVPITTVVSTLRFAYPRLKNWGISDRTLPEVILLVLNMHHSQPAQRFWFQLFWLADWQGDKTLTPSPWTTLMDKWTTLKWTTLKWTTPKKYYFRWVVCWEAAIIYLHCTEDAFLFVPHRPHLPFWITILKKTTAVHKKHRLKSNQIFCGQLNLAPMWFSSSVFLEQTKWSSGCYSWFVLLV